MEPTERREAVRQKCQVRRTVLATVGQPEQDPVSTHLYLVDLAENGLRVNLDRAFEPGLNLQVSLPLAAFGHELSGELNVLCRVVWNKPLTGGTCVHGLEFLETSEEERVSIKALMDCCGEREQRDTVRLAKPIDSKIWFEGDESWSPMVSIRELSTRGLNFPSSRSAAVGESLRFRLLLEPGTAEAKAKVRWCRQMPTGRYDIGCDFEELGESAQSYISLHLRRCHQRPL